MQGSSVEYQCQSCSYDVFTGDLHLPLNDLVAEGAARTEVDSREHPVATVVVSLDLYQLSFIVSSCIDSERWIFFKYIQSSL